MAIQVLIEPLPSHGFRASSGSPLAVSVDAPTREEALARLKQELGQRLRTGVELVSLELGPAAAGNPWIEFAGMFKDDPWIDDWKQSVGEYRRNKDAEKN